MKFVAVLIILCVAVALFQGWVAPAFVPAVLRPDAGLLAGIAVLAFAPRDFGFLALFVLGLQADLSISPRLGALTLCYLLAGAVVRAVVGREFERGEFLLPWLSSIGACALAHLVFCVLALVLGFQLPWGQVAGTLLSLSLAACVWGIPFTYLTAELLYRLRAAAPEIQARWTDERRISQTRNRQASS